MSTKSCLRNQTRLCIHLLVVLVTSCLLTRCFWGILLNQKISLYIILTSNVKINGICMRHSKCNIRMNKNPTLTRLFYFSHAKCLFFSRKRERAYFLCEDGIKTDT